MKKIQDETDKLSRREVAEMLNLHPDSISRLLPEGLASAVTRWGGSGKSMIFSRMLVSRWQRARLCFRNQGRPCVECLIVTDDCQVGAEHLLEVRHGAFETCGRGDDFCGHPSGEFCQPCS